VDAKELPKQSLKILFFQTYVASCALWDPFGGRSQRALHSENKQKSIGFTTFLTPLLSPTGAPKGISQISKRVPCCMGVLQQKKKRALRCMGTLSQFG